MFKRLSSPDSKTSFHFKCHSNHFGLIFQSNRILRYENNGRGRYRDVTSEILDKKGEKPITNVVEFKTVHNNIMMFIMMIGVIKKT